MRQIHELAKRIEVRKIEYRYPMQMFHANLKGAKIKPLEEILGMIEEGPKFDPETDALLQKHALKQIEETRRGGQQRTFNPD